jgi:transcriptional regulator of acetoin/glycerol metabolism
MPLWPFTEQVLRLASATCAGNKITRDDLSLPADESLVDSPISEGTEAIEMAERAVLARHLTKNRFDVARTATKLGMSRATLYRKIKRFGL